MSVGDVATREGFVTVTIGVVIVLLVGILLASRIAEQPSPEEAPA
jgi:hypothetical protein